MTTTTVERSVTSAVGAYVHQLMWQRKITQTTMAEALGVGQPTVGKKLRGLVAITLEDLATIAEVLGEDPGYLVQCACRDSNPKPSDLEPVGVRVVRCGVCGGWTLDGRCTTPHGDSGKRHLYTIPAVAA